MPLFIPKPVEEGGRYGYAAMGGHGFSVLDISNPAEMKEVGHLDLRPSISGTEADNLDVSQVESTGYVYVSGYPLTEDCYEPYKEIPLRRARPRSPRIAGVLSRPKPPKEAPFPDFCRGRGCFGPVKKGHTEAEG